MPSGTDVRSAAPITAPSTKLCTAPPNEHERRRRAMDFALVAVTVAPRAPAFRGRRSPECRRAACRTLAAPARRQGFRKHRHQRDAKKRAYGITHQPRHELRSRSRGQQQEQRRAEQAAEAAENGQAHGGSTEGTRGESYRSASVGDRVAISDRVASRHGCRPDCVSSRRSRAGRGRDTGSRAPRHGSCASGHLSSRPPGRRGSTCWLSSSAMLVVAGSRSLADRTISVRPPLSSVSSISAAAFTRSSVCSRPIASAADRFHGGCG